jgi:hypothetical protein
MSYEKRPIRRSALISPWGVGAIVPFPNDESLMIAGLDRWQYKYEDEFIIRDERLERRLGVKQLRLPPDYRERSAGSGNVKLKIPAVRFPRWHYCPYCGTMEKSTFYQRQPLCSKYQWPKGRNCDLKTRYSRLLIPERFIVVCPEGHIDDFPVAEWIHRDKPYNIDTCRIRRSTGGPSGSLAGIWYRCSCGASRNLANITASNSLSQINYKCKGSMPWLGIEQSEEGSCGKTGADVRVLLRGATNVWFSDTRSSILIPSYDFNTKEVVDQIADKILDLVNTSRVNGELNHALIAEFAKIHRVDADELHRALIRLIQSTDGEVVEDTEMTDDEYRLAEYNVLIKNSGSDKQEFHSINYSINEYDKIIRPYFDSITLIPKLRETRAFVGFSRLSPSQATVTAQRRKLSKETLDWLPAVVVYGEGIFFKFNKEKLNHWASQESVRKRVKSLNESYSKSIFGREIKGELRPEYVLIHTFAHLLINQLSFECGYGSSSLRERIYCESSDDKLGMYGVLIYTASGDSEGSLGGLVRQGSAGFIEDTILAVMKNAMWCTSDPICIQSSGQGPETLNLAACHNCALLPETSCEKGNRLLDRGLLIGTLSDDLGYFSEFRNL